MLALLHTNVLILTGLSSTLEADPYVPQHLHRSWECRRCRSRSRC